MKPNQRDIENARYIALLEMDLIKMKSNLKFTKSELERHKDKYHKALEEIGMLKYIIEMQVEGGEKQILKELLQHHGFIPSEDKKGDHND